MNQENPYLKKPAAEQSAPMIARIPMYDFDDPGSIESDLLPTEMCVARVPNPRQTGFTHDIALVYKDMDGNVMSLQMMQHHGELKDTPENREVLHGKEEIVRDETEDIPEET